MIRRLMALLRSSAVPTVPVLYRRVTAVDDEHLTGDERCLVGRQVERQAGDIFRLAEAMDRLPGLERVTAGRILPEVLAEVRLNQSRGEGIDADAVLAELLGPRTGHH